MQPLESPITPLTVAALRMIICKRPVPPDDHLQEVGPFGSSFARGRPLWMIICKRPVPLDHHLQEADHSRWPSARGRSLRIIICKRPALPDDHLQEACPSGSSFARGRPPILTTTTRAWKLHFWDPLQWEKMCFECQRIQYQWKKSKFSHLLTVRAEVADPPPPPLRSAWP